MTTPATPESRTPRTDAAEKQLRTLAMTGHHTPQDSVKHAINGARILETELLAAQARIAELERERDEALAAFEKAKEWNRLTELEITNLRDVFESNAKEASDLADGLTEETKLRERTQSALRDLIDAIPFETLENDKPLKAWVENAESVLLPPDIDPSCTHDEQEHGICLYCGMDCDTNSDRYGKYPNENWVVGYFEK